MKKIGWIIAIALVAVAALVFGSNREAGRGELTIGAVLPLTGPAALWGESVRNGMEMALEDYPDVRVVYEDSKGTGADGVSAFNVVQAKGVDLTVTALSAVSVPLAKLALERKVPVLATLTVSPSTLNEQTVRYYANPADYAGPAFRDDISPVKTAKKIGLLYRNDELGLAVFAKVKELAAAEGKELVYAESFKPAETDFLTVLSKLKGTGAEVLLFVPATAGEGLGIVRMAKQLNLSATLVEAGAAFADLEVRKQAGDIPFYSTSYEFTTAGKAEAFTERYQEKFGKLPNFAAGFGYDMIKLVDRCKAEKEQIRACIIKVKTNAGIAGTAEQIGPGDFSLPMHLEKVN